ncbi:hypothetical protein [Desnuesiella massiliensis]|uniref:hypothetical protein n=1 Tax=Desnuesiella massiliensis TaxID=1650662 RepID=UPI0006E465CB|nr:hypothetical protein [Desnuesiella massiliensis]
MILSFDIAIAIKNDYGSYNIIESSLFQLDSLFMNSTIVTFKKQKNRDILLKLICPLCGERHSYVCNFQEMINRNIIILGCKKLGTPVIYLGRTEIICDRIQKYHRIHSGVCAIL